MKKYILVFTVTVVSLFAQENKQYALEINPIGLFAKRISTAYTYFMPSSNGAIHIPVFYKNIVGNAPNNTGPIRVIDNRTFGENTLTLDVAYRYFLNHKDRGLYTQASTRVARLWGGFQDKSTTKLGLGIGLGTRKPIFNDNFYYTVGFNITKYFIGENLIFNHYGGIDMTTGLSDDSYFIMEFNLRIGYTF